MKKYFVVIILIFLSINYKTSSAQVMENPDSLIGSIVSQVEIDSIEYVIQTLQDFQTRFMLSDNRIDVVNWIQNRFYQIGITDVEIDSFMCFTSWNNSTTMQYNVVGTISGTSNPDEIYIIGAHYDSYASGSPMTSAPGADDNASGSSAVLEFARVMIESAYQPESTIKFILFGAEELMLFGDSGCEHYALEAYNSQMDLRIMINADMVSHTNEVTAESDVNINYYSGHGNLLYLAKDMTEQFSVLTPQTGAMNQYSDSYPFYAQGFPAVYFEENDFSPFYHTINDVISNYNMEYCAEVCKSAGATLLKHMFNSNITSTNNELNVQPSDFVLHQNYPNPFNPTTIISWQSLVSGHQSLKIYDVLGNEVATLVDEYRDAGSYEVEFQAKDLTSGIYFYQLKAGDFIQTKKLNLIK